MHVHRLGILVLAASFTMIACGEDLPSDGKLDPAAPPGKADDVYGACQVDQLLAWVNNPATSVEVLKKAGVHTRAARNIVAYRNGPDGLPATGDDNPFDDVQELDDVYFVGPVAFEQLVAAIDHLCQVQPVAEAIFSPQPYDTSHLSEVAEMIDAAQHSIDIAMYSYSDSNIGDALERAVNRGVLVRFIFESANEDRKDPEGTMSAALEDIGINVRYVNKIMHHKYAIIDGPLTSTDNAVSGILVTGSGNWSYSAGTRYDENTLILSGCDELLLQYQQEFNLLWENSRDFVWDESLEWLGSMEITDGMIPDNPALEAVFTSANFDIRTTSYGPTFTVVRGRSAVSDRLVELIEGATSSIHIASGHLRSRPVSEALLAKWASSPDMDIRIYLDGQEYISAWYHNEQEAELEVCLEEAGDSAARQQDCLDKGFYFSYPVYAAGIPLKFKYYAYRWDYHYAEQMHHKYILIDGRVLATGSYNLSDNAEHNTIENLAIIDRALFPGLVDAYEQNFETLWVTGEADGLYGDLVDLIENTQDPIPVVFDSMALGWEQVTYLKDIIREHCPQINSEAFRDDPNGHQTCYR